MKFNGRFDLELVGWGYNFDALRQCLRLSLNYCQEKTIRYSASIPGFDYSVHIFGQSHFENSAPLPGEISLEDLAQKLFWLAQDGALYPQKRPAPPNWKGWTIYKSTAAEGIVLASATWVDTDRWHR